MKFQNLSVKRLFGRVAHEAGAVVIRHKVNKGLGQTFRDAVEYAVVHGFDIMVNMDGDGQFNSQNIADLIAPILHNEADFVTGSRFMTGREIPHMPPIKRWGKTPVFLITSTVLAAASS